MREYYGEGQFVGFYPAHDVECCFAIVAAPAGTSRQVRTLGDVAERFGGMPDAVRKAFAQSDQTQALWQDDFYDVRAPKWAAGRVALVGDSAAAMLPTAGVGASMAMESAAVLAQELAISDSRLVSYALARYERRRRKRVDGVQSASRSLAWLVRVRGPFASARNFTFRHTTPKMFFGAFSNVLYSSM
jgi:2-polyprenyl-6-methoxyphenol hydroxylase-like FAD-dependent oxidoreductase